MSVRGLMCTALAAAAAFAAPPVPGAGVSFDAAERAAILRHGPWPPPWQGDPSNRVSRHPAAIALGRRLFFDAALSRERTHACASCHVPARGWTDGRPRSVGIEPLDRNAPTIANSRYARWFGRDGGADSLWSHAIRPLTDAREMAMTPDLIAERIAGDAGLAACYRRVFGPPGSDEDVMVNAAKAIAAFQETVVTGRNPFDDFRDAMARSDRLAMARYPQAAQRGLKLFVGRGNCAVCHFGPAFTNGEFADVGVPFFARPGVVDSGRHAGIRRVRESPHNLLGRFNDDRARATGVATLHLVLEHRHWGEFKVPGLRDVARTAPYMHAGSHATLADVVHHYSELNEDRLHLDGEKILRRLDLTAQESADLVAFLESLSAGRSARMRASGARRACR